MSPEPDHVPAPSHRTTLQADCASCFGLCCVVPAFAESADFGIDKKPGTPCPNLQTDFRCGIHERLRADGFPGCTVYDCFGAGQKVSQVTFRGRDWRQDRATATQMFAVFPVMRNLHELLWYLAEALDLEPARPIHTDLARVYEDVDALTRLTPGALVAVDVDAVRTGANALLARASELTRAATGTRGPDRRGADLVGAKLAGADLRGAVLRGAYLIGANLRDADLRGADLIGADLRGADLRGATLDGALFVTQAQLNAATGDASTGLPAHLTRPSHWEAGPSRSATAATPRSNRPRRKTTRRP